MENILIRKMILRALKDYLWEEEDCILNEEEWRQLETKIMTLVKQENQEEALYTIIQDVIYDYFTNK